MSPIFEYRCSVCGEEFERIIIGEEDEAGGCPNCLYGGPFERLVSAPAIAKLADGFVAQRWDGKNGAASSKGVNH